MIFTHGFVAQENHWQITSFVRKKVLFAVTHASFFIYWFYHKNLLCQIIYEQHMYNMTMMQICDIFLQVYRYLQPLEMSNNIILNFANVILIFKSNSSILTFLGYRILGCLCSDCIMWVLAAFLGFYPPVMDSWTHHSRQCRGTQLVSANWRSH